MNTDELHKTRMFRTGIRGKGKEFPNLGLIKSGENRGVCSYRNTHSCYSLGLWSCSNLTAINLLNLPLPTTELNMDPDLRGKKKSALKKIEVLTLCHTSLENSS